MAKTISELRNQSIQVRDASAAGENTATRVGTVLNDIVGHIEDYENTQSSNNSSQDAKIEGVKSSLNAEIARAKTEESNLSTQIGTERTERQAAVSREETARIQADNDEKTARMAADNAEQDARIKADNDEKTARENADITLRTMIQTEVSNRQIAVKQEEIRAMAAEAANAQAIEDETARAMAAEEAETSRATAEEQRLQDEIDNTNTNVETLEDKVNSNHDHLTDEVARLDTKDIEIKADLEAESVRATAAEKANADNIAKNAEAITDEVARAQKVELANTTAIAKNKEDIAKNADKISELEGKTSEINKEVIETEEDSISIEDNNGNEVFHIDENGLDAKNLKSNGKEVLTEHQDISGLATKEEVAGKQDIIPQVSQDSTSSDIDEQIFASDDYNEETGTGEKYASIGSYGVKSKAYLDLDGKPILGKKEILHPVINGIDSDASSPSSDRKTNCTVKQINITNPASRIDFFIPNHVYSVRCDNIICDHSEGMALTTNDKNGNAYNLTSKVRYNECRFIALEGITKININVVVAPHNTAETVSVKNLKIEDLGELTDLYSDGEYDARMSSMTSLVYKDTTQYSTVKPLNFMVFSDIHENFYNLRSMLNFYKRYAGNINDVVCCGDILDEDFANGSFNYWFDEGASNILNCIGNHDSRNKAAGNWSYYNEAQCYKRFFVGYENDSWNDETKLNSTPICSSWGAIFGGSNVCYYYKDYDNVRIVVVDCMHWNNNTNQQNWVVNTLEDARVKNLSVILVNHAVPWTDGWKKFDTGFQNIYRPNDGTGKKGGYANGLTDYVSAFINNGGKFICHIVGHLHTDDCGVIDGNQIFIGVQSADFRKTDGDGCGDKILFDKSQDAFNIVSVDTENKLIRVMRVGNEYDKALRHIGNMVINYDTKELVGTN